MTHLNLLIILKARFLQEETRILKSAPPDGFVEDKGVQYYLGLVCFYLKITPLCVSSNLLSKKEESKKLKGNFFILVDILYPKIH